jgi:hypothetical protein
MYTLYTLYIFRGNLAHHNKQKRRFILRILSIYFDILSYTLRIL